ncbi:MAG: hypothetical protein N2035_08225 [Chthoniobacterales bacterium]|nr:hypothetical protein [Chthoniobacterales bacterium]
MQELNQEIPFEDFPLINEKIANENLSGEDDFLEETREFWRGVKKSLKEDLEEIKRLYWEGKFKQCKEKSHSTKGYVGTAGLMRLHRALLHLTRRLEIGDIPEPKEAEEMFLKFVVWRDESIIQMEKLLPHLCDS